MQRQGREREAHTIYNKLLRNEPSDIGLTTVAIKNLIAAKKKDQNIFDSKKWIKAATMGVLRQS